MEATLRYVYYNPKSPGYLSSLRNVYKEAKRLRNEITQEIVQKYLEKQNTYTLHKQVKRRFPRNRVISLGLMVDWEADLIDLSKIKKYNRNIPWVLTVIDILSKKAFAVPAESKGPKDMIKAFSKVLKMAKTKPWFLGTDAGLEFMSKDFQKFLYENDIIHKKSKNPDIKCSIAERYNRSLKELMWKYFTQNQSFSYLKALPRLVQCLNRRYHRSIKMRPCDVTEKNERTVWQTLYGELRPKKAARLKFSPGDKVRISKAKHIFEKGYVPNFTKEIFTITKQVNSNPPTYEICDENNETIKGYFFENELVSFTGKIPARKRYKRKN